MPLSTYMILQSPQVALIKTTSSQIALTLQGVKAVIGVVDTVNYLNIKSLYLGSVYLFDKTNAVIISAGGNEYFVINENDIKGKELPLL